MEREKEFVSELIYSKIVSSGKAGGRKFMFSSFSISGNKRNKLGLGDGKASQANTSIKKSIFNSIKKYEYFDLNNKIPFETSGKYKSSLVILKPCSKTNGLKAGGVVRKILTLLGIENVTSKIYGSRHPRNVALATIEALKKIKDIETVNKNREHKKSILKNKITINSKVEDSLEENTKSK